MSVRTIEWITVGHRRIAGTDHPVKHLIERHQFGRKVEWVVIEGLCNGVSRSAMVYRTLREARRRMRLAAALGLVKLGYSHDAAAAQVAGWPAERS